eukprot:894823-Amphidinium_carterae.1
MAGWVWIGPCCERCRHWLVSVWWGDQNAASFPLVAVACAVDSSAAYPAEWRHFGQPVAAHRDWHSPVVVF